MDGLLLKVFMKQYGDTTETLAEALGIYPKTLQYKIQNKRQQFTQNEILTIGLRYNLSPDEVTKIFFKPLSKLDNLKGGEQVDSAGSSENA